MEIKGVIGNEEKMVKEDDLHEMPYLKAVILEGLRNGTMNFMIGDMGMDPKVWEDPMSFKPERFVMSAEDGEGFDITGSKEIKMMPFGARRRICPGYVLALLHLEYFVANLVWNFEWKAGGDINMEEQREFSVRMKHPLQALISPRFL
ncbi:hypothetical protein Godav_000862 [Gossypium davidsonii]|nr:hypothetical protein [Gossypium davidsonii]